MKLITTTIIMNSRKYKQFLQQTFKFKENSDMKSQLQTYTALPGTRILGLFTHCVTGR